MQITVLHYVLLAASPYSPDGTIRTYRQTVQYTRTPNNHRILFVSPTSLHIACALTTSLREGGNARACTQNHTCAHKHAHTRTHIHTTRTHAHAQAKHAHHFTEYTTNAIATPHNFCIAIPNWRAYNIAIAYHPTPALTLPTLTLLYQVDNRDH
jgi:hypothetical protein